MTADRASSGKRPTGGNRCDPDGVPRVVRADTAGGARRCRTRAVCGAVCRRAARWARSNGRRRGDELVDYTASAERRRPLTTLRDAGEFVGILPGAPALWTPVTPLDLDASL